MGREQSEGRGVRLMRLGVTQVRAVTSQVIAAGAWGVVQFDTLVRGPARTFDTRQFRFQPRAAGDYLLRANVYATAARAGNTAFLACFVNGALAWEMGEQPTGVSLNGSAIVQLTEEDYVDIRVYPATAALTLYGSTAPYVNFFHAVLVSPRAQQ